MATIGDPGYWASDVRGLGDALVNVVASPAPPQSRDLDPAASVLAFFGAELRRLRADADLSQEQLAEQINYSPALVGVVETARRMPSRDFASRCDAALQTDGALARLWPLVTRDVLPTWFRPWVQDVESEATTLRSWEPLIIPGLLQTPDYARALLGAFVIASNKTETVYLETASSGQITELPSVVEEITLTWEAPRSEALPRSASRDLIARVAEERWT